jgi:hypothetical protein
MGKRLRYADLKDRGIVNNRQTLKNWQNDPKVNFPKGQLTGPNTRTWDEDEEIIPWLESRPTDPKSAPVVTKPESEWKGRRGRRPRKADRTGVEAT